MPRGPELTVSRSYHGRIKNNSSGTSRRSHGHAVYTGAAGVGTSRLVAATLGEEDLCAGRIEIMGRDKKSDGRALNMVLLRAPGDVLTHQDPDPAVVRAAVEELVP